MDANVYATVTIQWVEGYTDKVYEYVVESRGEKRWKPREGTSWHVNYIENKSGNIIPAAPESVFTIIRYNEGIRRKEINEKCLSKRMIFNEGLVTIRNKITVKRRKK